MPESTQALVYVEIDIEFCSLLYGVAPCTASGGPKCFNSRATCQDLPNYDPETVTLRFTLPTDYLPRNIDAIPSLEEVSSQPATVSLGGDLGQRATLTASFRDHPWSDTGEGFDKYVAERAYDPFLQGSFWGKFRSRQPYLRGRNLRVIRGLVNSSFVDAVPMGTALPSAALLEQETRHYVIESYDGPAPGVDGKFSIAAKDILKLADNDRAQVPRMSNGFLVTGISDVATSATLSPAGIGNAEYDASGFVAIGGKEICSFTRSGDALTLTRAQLNTPAQAHAAQDRVQLVYRVVGGDAADILYDWLVNYAEIDASFITLSEWQSETASFLARVYTFSISEPTGVNKLASELMEQIGGAAWWDDEAQKIRLQILRAIPTQADRWNEDNVLAESIASREQPNKRVSRVQIYFGQVNSLRPVDEPDNYRSSAEVFDADSEEAEGSAVIKRIFARGVAAGGRSVATRIGELHLSRYVRPPRRFNFDLMKYSGPEPILGGGYRLGGGDPRIGSWPFQDATGDRADVPIQLTRLESSDTRYKLEAEEVLFTAFGGDIDPDERVIIFDVNEYNVNLRARHDELYPVPVAGNNVTCIIYEGVTIGSTSTGVYSFIVGGWPTVAATGNQTSGSPIITGLSVDTSGLYVGNHVVGSGIPANTKILSIDSPTQVTLDKNAGATATGVALTFYVINLTLIIYGGIRGKGGAGGNGQLFSSVSGGSPGLAGGPAVYSDYKIDLEFIGVIGSGGGGGGGGGGTALVAPFFYQGGGGGGGAGRDSGPGGGGGANGGPGNELNGGPGGVPSFGGAGGPGGGLGENGGPGASGVVFGVSTPGGSGGSAGYAIVGASYFNITISSGVLLGPTTG